MSEHDSPISIHGGGTLAKAIVSEGKGHWNVPDGAVLSPWSRRVASFVIDVVIVGSILMLVTDSMIRNAWNLSLWASRDFHYSAAFAGVFLVSNWLYWRVTGMLFSRSFGQKILGIAIVMEDGTRVSSEVWDYRSARKLLYLLPIVNVYIGVYEIARISQRHTHQSNLDLRVGTISALADSLPPASRRHIR